MGEAAKNIKPQEMHHQVAQLRSDIAHKRHELTQELQELRRRRAAATDDIKRTAKAVGLAAIGALCIASLVNAFTDVIGREHEEDEEQSQPEEALTTALAGFAVMVLRTVASQYIKTQLSILRDRIESAREDNTLSASVD